MIFLITILLLIAFIVILTVYKKSQLHDFTHFNEDNVSGNFLKLSKGRVHYNRYGDKSHNTVVLVHGVLTPSFVWDGVIDTLVQAGNEVITFDLYGRGYSERLKGPYDEKLYNEQLLNLLDSLNINKPIDLIGYSLGGGIAVSFSSHYPRRVKKIGLIAPAGFMSEMPLIARIAKLPFIGEYISHLFIPMFTIKRQKQAFEQQKISAEALFKTKQQFSYKGTVESLISTDKYYPYNALKSAYELVYKSQIPVSLIWGEDDELMLFKFSEQVLQAIPSAEFHPVPHASHSITYAQSEIVGPLLKDFVAKLA